MAIFYSPAEYKVWQADAAKLLADIKANVEPYDGVVEVTILAVAERPKTTKLLVPKPDVDNYAKGVLDAITYAEKFWKDDTQVADLIARKRWSSPDRPAGIHVNITPIDPKDL